ncbi:hypothetical protein JTB14_024990 [Gonioctena quinquepunctata]|nr:hypothetical protein JTB14_024990 [Gonioctena quinquepunctata]
MKDTTESNAKDRSLRKKDFTEFRLGTVSKLLPEIESEEKVYCYLKNIQEHGMIEPYALKERRSGDTDDLNIETDKSERLLYNFPYLDVLNEPKESKGTNDDKIHIIDCKILPVSLTAKPIFNFATNTTLEKHNEKCETGSKTSSSKSLSDNSYLDSDYEPLSSDNSNYFISGHNSDRNIEEQEIAKDISVGTHRDNEPSLAENSDSDHSNSGNNHYANIGEKVNISGTKKNYRPPYNREHTKYHSTRTYKDLCPFCFEDVGHFSRHLIRQHSDEEAVRKIMEMKNKSREKRMAIIALRKKGNFILNSERNELKPVRKPSKGVEKTEGEYYPCTACLGFYKKTYLWRHRKTCSALIFRKKVGFKTQHLSEAQTFLAATGMLGNHLNKSRLKTEVFSVMRPDQISFAAKSDPLICLYGESYLNKHKRKQMGVVTSNRMREIARLKLALQKFTMIRNTIDILKPEMYDNLVTASKIISGYDDENKTFKASSLALHLGTNLKFLCDIAKKALITKNPLFPTSDEKDRDQKLKEISEIRDMIENHSCNDLSSLANKVLNENKIEKPKLVPLTEDIRCFNNYITTLASEAYKKLRNREDIPKNYKILAECSLCFVLVFNRKRIGEVQFLDINSYERDISSVNQEEFSNCLTEFEKNMSSCLKRVVVFGKGSKPVPILFTKLMQIYIELLLKIRKDTEIVPKENKYVFANPGSTDRWMSGSHIIRKFAFKCGAKKPELLTSTKFRKQIATLLQLMNFQNDEMEQIARFMGHTEKTHREFYRLTEDTYQTAKVAKVLLLLNAGKGNEFKGKSLNEIEVDQEVVDIFEDNISEEDIDESSSRGITSYDTSDVSEITEHRVKSPKENISNSKTHRRIRWSDAEKKLVFKFFKKNIEKKKAPKKGECLDFIRLNKSFMESDWLRIKTLVYNTYRLQ